MLSRSRQRLLQRMCSAYGVMLRAYPLGFRREYSREMLLTFRSHARDILENENGWVLLPFSVKVVWDWLTTVSRERCGMDILRKALLAAVTTLCLLSILASCFLAVSYATLKGLGDVRPLMPLAFIVAQGAITLIALRAILSEFGIDVFALVGALAMAWLGYSMVERTLTGSHFEGYALVLGAISILQGTLTLMLFLWRMLGRKVGFV
jgi:hypothetical protein